MKKIINTLILIALLLGSYNKINGQMSNNEVPADLKINSAEAKPNKLKSKTKNIHISSQCMIGGAAMIAASIISMSTNNNGNNWSEPGIAKHITPDRMALGIGISIFSYGIIIKF
jgi:hypothetical protein|tara:strand:- start:2449 stop:2793 length:345 start_codon:yes stop_codon:yes gene_type:complete